MKQPESQNIRNNKKRIKQDDKLNLCLLNVFNKENNSHQHLMDTQSDVKRTEKDQNTNLKKCIYLLPSSSSVEGLEDNKL